MARKELIAPIVIPGSKAQIGIIAQEEARMPKRLPKDADEQVVTHVENSPDGLGIEALSRLLGDQISRRTLQRRLSQLVATGELISEKKGRSTRYLLPPSTGEAKRAESSTGEAKKEE